jgi:hypothetical protein
MIEISNLFVPLFLNSGPDAGGNHKHDFYVSGANCRSWAFHQTSKNKAVPEPPCVEEDEEQKSSDIPGRQVPGG